MMLGSTRAAKVYLGVYELQKQVVAIKQLIGPYNSTKSDIDEKKYEANMMRLVDGSPYIIKLHD